MLKELAAAVRDKNVSARELVEESLRRIDAGTISSTRSSGCAPTRRSPKPTRWTSRAAPVRSPDSRCS